MDILNALLISNELVEVKPMNSPKGSLFYIDYQYTSLIEMRKKKIEKILEKIKKAE